MSDSVFGEPIFSYTRAQAIEDGELIDVSPTAREAGIKFHSVVSRNLWVSYVEPTPADEKQGQPARGRLWDILNLLRFEAKRGPARDHIEFTCAFQINGRRKLAKIWAICGPGDDAEPTITIMLPEDY